MKNFSKIKIYPNNKCALNKKICLKFAITEEIKVRQKQNQTLTKKANISHIYAINLDIPEYHQAVLK